MLLAAVSSWLPSAKPAVTLRRPGIAASSRVLHGLRLAADEEQDMIDMEMLMRRMEDNRQGLTDCKLYVVTGAMVPGQRMEFTAPPELVELFLNIVKIMGFHLKIKISVF